MQKISVTLQEKNSNSKFLIEDRRRTVARLLAQSMTETEIAIRLDVHVSTICRCTTPLITAQHGIRANEAANIMFTNNMKRLPLTQDGKIVSIVTARDLVEALQEEH
jgi:signal-transduction protein with cAMP-binding, CBS, and nucleotidyltransferase domain